MTPFGSPVVPEVNMISATSLGSMVSIEEGSKDIYLFSNVSRSTKDKSLVHS